MSTRTKWEVIILVALIITASVMWGNLIYGWVTN